MQYAYNHPQEATYHMIQQQTQICAVTFHSTSSYVQTQLRRIHLKILEPQHEHTWYLSRIAYLHGINKPAAGAFEGNDENASYHCVISGSPHIWADNGCF